MHVRFISTMSTQLPAPEAGSMGSRTNCLASMGAMTMPDCWAHVGEVVCKLAISTALTGTPEVTVMSPDALSSMSESSVYSEVTRARWYIDQRMRSFFQNGMSCQTTVAPFNSTSRC